MSIVSVFCSPCYHLLNKNHNIKFWAKIGVNACDNCRRCSQRCLSSIDPEDPRCTRCVRHGLGCLFCGNSVYNESPGIDILDVFDYSQGVRKTSQVCIDHQSVPTKTPPCGIEFDEDDASGDEWYVDLPNKQKSTIGNFKSINVETDVGHKCGVRRVFELSMGNNILKCCTIRQRVRLQRAPSVVAFIECPMFFTGNQARDCNGAIIAYTLDEKSWFLGIVASLILTNKTEDHHALPDGIIFIYSWTGRATWVNNILTPAFYLCDLADDRNQHMSQIHIQFRKTSQFKFVFLNQLCGPSPIGSRLSFGVINSVDGCIQCSPDGPDTCPGYFQRPLKHFSQQESSSIGIVNLKSKFQLPPRYLQASTIEVTSDLTNLQPVIVENKDHGKRWRSKFIKIAVESDLHYAAT